MNKHVDWHKDALTPETLISEGFRTTQNVRRFFQSQITSAFTFDREFRKWLQSNEGKTLGEAVAVYKRSKR